MELPMSRSHFILMTTALCVGLGFAGTARQTSAQSATQKFVGTWSLGSIVYVSPDGHKIEPFGHDAKGLLYFDAGGHFATQVMRVDRPPFASNNRMLGTPDENKSASQGVVAYFGTYNVDESNRILTLHIEQSSFPNWNGTDQKRMFAFSGDQLRYTAASSTANPGESAELIWKKLR
jgi:Lipocalin-like domain